jgi:integrase
MSTAGQRLRELPKGKSLVLEKIPGGGSLEARRLSSEAIQFYWRYTSDKKTERIPIGLYDSSAPPKSLSRSNRGFSIAAALECARELAKANQSTPGGLRAERKRQEAKREQEAAFKAAREKYSLKSLCLDYCAWLKKQGKWSHKEALNIFENHLFKAVPKTAAKPAAEVEKREIVAAVRMLTEAGKGATARKLRSYLRAAYACAVKADSDATLPSSFISYDVPMNPVEATAAIRGTIDKNPLSGAELRRYWKALANEEGVIGAALRLHVVTGGQRLAQLARLCAGEGVTDSEIKLVDPKGKRAQPREHLLPLTRAIRDELRRLPTSGFALSTDGGKTAMHPSSLSKWAAEVGRRAGIKDFQLKRVRSGIETMLAAARVDKQTRGQLQSHGIGGVQDTHYDAHTYMPEKQRALQVLYRMLRA